MRWGCHQLLKDRKKAKISFPPHLSNPQTTVFMNLMHISQGKCYELLVYVTNCVICTNFRCTVCNVWFLFSRINISYLVFLFWSSVEDITWKFEQIANCSVRNGYHWIYREKNHFCSFSIGLPLHCRSDDVRNSKWEQSEKSYSKMTSASGVSKRYNAFAANYSSTYSRSSAFAQQDTDTCVIIICVIASIWYCSRVLRNKNKSQIRKARPNNLRLGR